MTATEKKNKIKLLLDDIEIFQKIVDSNPNDTLSKDILFFKKRQLKDTELTPSEEELNDKMLFDLVLKRQEEVVNSVKTTENKSIKNIIVYFNSSSSSFEVKYTINNEDKKREYAFDKEFLEETLKAFEKLKQKYGEEMSKEYDKIIYGVLFKLDTDLGTKLLTEFLNNNKTFTILYDFRDFYSLKRNFRKIIEKSYKKNKPKTNVFIIKNDSKEDLELFSKIMKDKENQKEEDKVIEFKLEVKEPEIIPLKIDMLKKAASDLEKIKREKEDIEVLDTKENDMGLKEIFNLDDDIEILGEEPKKM